jgi:metal-responsive CopG/Arc/MetJ family transcriptional regulator
MASSIYDIPKKRRGRPKTTGRQEGVLVRMSREELDRLDRWMTAQGLTSRPEAIRRILTTALGKARRK